VLDREVGFLLQLLDLVFKILHFCGQMLDSLHVHFLSLLKLADVVLVLSKLVQHFLLVNWFLEHKLRWFLLYLRRLC